MLRRVTNTPPLGHRHSFPSCWECWWLTALSQITLWKPPSKRELPFPRSCLLHEGSLRPRVSRAEVQSPGPLAQLQSSQWDHLRSLLWMYLSLTPPSALSCFLHPWQVLVPREARKLSANRSPTQSLFPGESNPRQCVTDGRRIKLYIVARRPLREGNVWAESWIMRRDSALRICLGKVSPEYISTYIRG